MMLLAGLLLLLVGCSSPAAAAKLTDLQPAERTRTALLAKVAAGEAIAGLPAARLTAANGQADEHVYVPELEDDKGKAARAAWGLTAYGKAPFVSRKLLALMGDEHVVWVVPVGDERTRRPSANAANFRLRHATSEDKTKDRLLAFRGAGVVWVANGLAAKLQKLTEVRGSSLSRTRELTAAGRQ